MARRTVNTHLGGSHGGPQLPREAALQVPLCGLGGAVCRCSPHPRCHDALARPLVQRPLGLGLGAGRADGDDAGDVCRQGCRRPAAHPLCSGACAPGRPFAAGCCDLPPAASGAAPRGGSAGAAARHAPHPCALAMDSMDPGSGGWEGLYSSGQAAASNAMAPPPTVPMAALQLLARTDVLARLVGVIADHAVPAGTPGWTAAAGDADGGGDGAAATTAGGGGTVEVPDDRRVREATLANAAGTLLELSRQLLQIRGSGVAIPDPLNVFARGDLCGQLLDAGLAAAAAGYPGALHIALDTLGRLLTTPANVALVPPAEEGGDGATAASDDDDLFDWDGTGGGGGGGGGRCDAARRRRRSQCSRRPGRGGAGGTGEWR
eukprot:TRINITY_DN3005_c2_g1_i1.p2 TRINITY_DN3005_c2_g1~~TRINITY_DN3005_c2_g1_i1.p2  ORF type:complete len:377 (+),score=67.45 TRINITY_DN3005_c2_g1_i1:911-2041(+)